MKKLALISCTLLLLWQTQALALGLGNPTTQTTIGNPLLVEIPIIGMDDLKPEDISISTPDATIYRKIHVEKTTIDSSLSFEISTATGQPVLVIRSKKSIKEPNVNFLVLMTSAKGNVLKEVSLLLDTPKQ